MVWTAVHSFPFIKTDTQNHTWELPVQGTARLFSDEVRF